MEDRNKTSFILHIDSLCVLDKMTEQQAGTLFKAIYFYQKNGTLPELDFAIDMAITPFVNQFKRDDIKYFEFLDKQKNNGSKGGRPKKIADNESFTENPQEPNLTQETQAFFEKPKKPYSVSVSDSVNKSNSVSKNKKDNTFNAKIFLSENLASENLIDEWFQVRKLKKLPNTKTAMEDFLKEVNKSNNSIDEILKTCIIKSWGGFKNKWLENEAITAVKNGNSLQWENGSANGIQRPAGKQPHVFSGAEFSAKVQERIKNQGLFD